MQTWRTRRGEEEEEEARPVLTGDVQSGDIKVIFKNKGNCHYRVRSDAHVDGGCESLPSPCTGAPGPLVFAVLITSFKGSRREES